MYIVRNLLGKNEPQGSNFLQVTNRKFKNKPFFILKIQNFVSLLFNQYQYVLSFSTGLTEKANNYYKMFITWTNEKIRKTFVEKNMFEFRHIKPFDRSYIQNPGPMVVLATPGMLHGGLSLQIFEGN